MKTIFKAEVINCKWNSQPQFRLQISSCFYVFVARSLCPRTREYPHNTVHFKAESLRTENLLYLRSGQCWREYRTIGLDILNTIDLHFMVAYFEAVA